MRHSLVSEPLKAIQRIGERSLTGEGRAAPPDLRNPENALPQQQCDQESAFRLGS